MTLCRCSYLILGILRERRAVDKVHGLTISEIQALEKMSRPNTIHKKVKVMEDLEFVKEGVKVGKAKSYYVTIKGLQELPVKIAKGATA